MSAARHLPHRIWRIGQLTHVITSKQHRTYTVFMHPNVFIPSWVILGILFGFQEWTNYSRWGYHVGAAITLESWGMEYLVLGVLCWLMWRFLHRYIVRASVRDMLTWIFLISLTFGYVKEMIWVLFFPNVPVD